MEELAAADVEQTSELQQLKEQLHVQTELARQAEARLRHLTEELERQVAEKTFELRRANAALQRQLDGQKRLVAGLRQERKFMSALLNTSAALIVVLDRHKCIVRFNRACERTTGYSFREVRGKQVHNLFLLPEERERVKAVCGRITADSSPNYCENYWVAKDGSRRLIAWSNTPILNKCKEVEYIIAVGIDITEGVRSSSDLQEREQFIQRIADATPGILYLYDRIEQRNVYVNSAVAEFLDYTPEQIEPMKTNLISHLLHPDDLEQLVEQSQKRIAQAEDGEILEIEYRLRHANGDWRWFQSRETVFNRTDRGIVKQIVGVAQDITVRKQAEEALQKSQRFIHRIAEAVPGLIYIYDLNENRNIYVNQQASTILGYTPEEIQKLGSALFRTIMHPEDWARISKLVASFPALKDGEASETEYRLRHANGEWRWFMSRDTVFSRNPDGSPAQTLGTVIDITARKQAAQEREKLAALVENSYDFIAIAALNGQLLYVNQAGCQPIGLAAVDAVSSKCLLDFVHPQDREFWLQEVLPSIRQAGRWEGELGFGHFQTGELIPMRVHGFAIEDPQTKETIGLATVSHNISEQKLAEEKLRRKTSEMEAIFQVLPDLYFRVDADGTYLDYHAGQKQDLYVPPTQFISKKVSEVLPPNVSDRICSAIHQVLQTGELVILEFSLSMANGEQWYETRLLPFLEQEVISIVRNITEKKQAEDALKRSEKLYRTLVENFPNGAVILFDRDFRYTIADGQELVAAGLSKENLEGQTLWEAVSPKNREILEPKYRAALAGEQNTFELSYADQIYSMTALPVRNEKGEIFAGMVVSQNISERKQAISVLQQAKQELEIRVEERTSELKIANALLRQEIAERLRVEAALRESEERFRSIFDRAAVGIAQVLLSGQFFLANQKFVDIVGYTVAELQQKTFPQITHPDDLTTNLAYYRQISTGEIHNYSMEKRYIRKDGLAVWVNMTVSLLRGNTGEPKYFILVVEDISDRKQAEAQIKASLQEKETLLKEIHHRVKNNMQVISSLLELQSQSVNDDQTSALFRESQHRIHSMALIHEQLYQSEHLDLINFAEYIENLAANLFQSFGCTRNSIHLNLQVGKIFLNIETAIPCGLIINELVSNSLKYAFPKGNQGQISIIFSQANSHQFHLKIGDNGVGLPPDFDIETAETLGLRLVRILTRQLKGVLEVDRH
ncbi:PAS domain S-box protein, partial [Planktothrix sp. FACHB-1355]